MTHEDMWTHISKDIIEKQYGGNLPNINDSYWPPNKQLLLFVDHSKNTENGLISQQQYRIMFKDERLKDRKILKKFVQKDIPKPI